MLEIPVQDTLGFIGIFFFISGFFFIIAGLGIFKVEKITVKTGFKTWGFGLLLAAIGIIFLYPEIYSSFLIKPSETSSENLTPSIEATQTLDYQMSETPSPTIKSSETIAPSITPKASLIFTNTVTALITITNTPSPPSPFVINLLPETIHLGDQDFDGWEPLSGLCFQEFFQVEFPVREMKLKLETFGTESNNTISLNGNVVSILPPQGKMSPDEWTDSRSVSIPIYGLIEGMNIIQICSELVKEEPAFTGDLDDFQLRNIIIIVNGS